MLIPLLVLEAYCNRTRDHYDAGGLGVPLAARQQMHAELVVLFGPDWWDKHVPEVQAIWKREEWLAREGERVLV